MIVTIRRWLRFAMVASIAGLFAAHGWFVTAGAYLVSVVGGVLLRASYDTVRTPAPEASDA